MFKRIFSACHDNAPVLGQSYLQLTAASCRVQEQQNCRESPVRHAHMRAREVADF